MLDGSEELLAGCREMPKGSIAYTGREQRDGGGK